MEDGIIADLGLYHASMRDSNFRVQAKTLWLVVIQSIDSAMNKHGLFAAIVLQVHSILIDFRQAFTACTFAFEFC